MIGRTVIDNRGGYPDRWVLLQDGEERLMRVADEMRDCVVFLYARVKGQLRPAGTAFFVFKAVPGHPGRTLGVLLTAHHVIAGITKRSDDRIVVIRANNRGSGAQTFNVSVDAWDQPDESVDCAVLLWVPPPETNVAFGGWLLDDGVATDEVMRKEGIGIGEEVFTVGLFRNHLGQDRNEPILRVGNIAALPVDPISTKAYGPMRAILIEARSIGGLSGSPVFVHLGGVRVTEDKRVVMDDGTGRPFFFLGLMHGHWDALDTEVDAPMLDPGVEKLNMGIGIVVPAEQIMRALGPGLDVYVTAARAQLDAEQEPTPDALSPDDDEFDRFEELTRKLVQVPKDELDNKLKES